MSDQNPTIRDQIIGLGRSSYKKSYYPDLQKKISELNIFKIAFEKLSEAVCFINMTNGTVTYSNEAFIRLLSFGNEDLSEKKIQDILNDRFWEQLKESAETGDSFKFEDDTIEGMISIEVSSNIIVDGGTTLIVTILRDIGNELEYQNQLEEKSYEISVQNKAYQEVNKLLVEKNDRIAEINEKLKENENMLQSIIRAAPMMLGVVKNRVFDFVSEYFLSQTGYKKEEVIGKASLFLYPSKEEFERVGKEKYENIAKDGVGSVETKWLCKDGGVIDIILSSSPIDQSDWDKGVTFTAIDISERVRAENELLSNRERLRLAIESTEDGLFDINLKNKEVYYSPRWYSMLGYSCDEFENSMETFIQLVHPEEKEMCLKISQDFFAGRIDEYNAEFRMIAKDGSTRWIMARGKVVEKDSEGKVQRITGTHTDITNRKINEIKLKESEAALREAQKIAKTGSWMYNFAKDCTEYSDGMRLLLDMDENEAPYNIEEFMSMIHPVDIPIVQWNFQKQQEGRSYFICDFRLRTKQGKEKFVEMRGSAIRTQDGTLIGNKGIMTDITERRKNEIEIERNLNLVKLLYENTVDFLEINNEKEIYDNMTKLINSLIPKSLVTYLSFDSNSDFLVLESIRGKKIEKLPELMGRKIENLKFPIDRKKYPEIWVNIYKNSFFEVKEGIDSANDIGINRTAIKAIKKIINMGKVYCKGVHKEGVLLGCIFIMLESGAEIDYKQMIETITNQSASSLQKLYAEKRLSESEIKYRTIFEHAPIGIFRADPNSKIYEANYEIAKIMGVSNSEKLLNNTNTLSRIIKRRIDEINKKTNLMKFEETFYTENELEVITNITCKIIRNQDSSIDYIEGMVEDITERKRSEQMIRESNANLEEMVYIASHDLQVPLVSMEGYAQELLNSYGNKIDSDGVYCLERLKSNAVRMHNLVVSLLDISRLNTKKYPYTKFELYQVVEKVVKDLSLAIEESKVDVIIGQLPKLFADKLRIEIVFRNIISNSINYGAKQIVISYEAGLISVRDDGIGIPKAQLKKIFKPGERIKSVKVDGVGMGLTFSKKVIDQHGGKIWAESKGRNKGTTMNIELNNANILE
jgi:PAS domain S-box-containing protein